MPGGDPAVDSARLHDDLATVGHLLAVKHVRDMQNHALTSSKVEERCANDRTARAGDDVCGVHAVKIPFIG